MAMALLMPTPQVTAMRAIAIDGACGPWSTAATSAASSSSACACVGSSPRSISQIICGKQSAADQLLDRIAAQPIGRARHRMIVGPPPVRERFRSDSSHQITPSARTARVQSADSRGRRAIASLSCAERRGRRQVRASASVGEAGSRRCATVTGRSTPGASS